MKRRKIQTKSKFLNWVLDWVDAILFAVVVVTLINTFWFQSFKIPSSSMEKTLYTGDHLFVSKLTFGARMPETPLTIPFTHNVFFGKESYSTSVRWKYRRLPGFREIRRGDAVVFNFPNGDTVLVNYPSDDYHALVRFFGKEQVRSLGPVVVRPMDKKDHYVKRCVALHGDTLEVRDGLVWVNGEKQEVYPGIQLSRNLETEADYREIFPFSPAYSWTRDYFGPLWIPEAGATVALTRENLPLYERIIRDYEGGDVQKALEEGSYTFRQNYYFMMGDNRHNSLDSRYWGFVPEDHIVGRPAVIWLSTNKGKAFPKNIRWNRFLKFL